MRKWARELTGEAGGDLAGPCLPLPTLSAMTAPASFVATKPASQYFPAWKFLPFLWQVNSHSGFRTKTEAPLSSSGTVSPWRAVTGTSQCWFVCVYQSGKDAN